MLTIHLFWEKIIFTQNFEIILSLLENLSLIQNGNHCNLKWENDLHSRENNYLLNIDSWENDNSNVREIKYVLQSHSTV